MIIDLAARSIPEPNSGCWIWLGHLKPNGYGTLGVKKDGRWKTTHAHRYAYEQEIGAIPGGTDLDHRCRNRCCINPAHLEPVTRSENLRRSPIMGRQAHKQTCPQGHPYSGVNRRGQRICNLCGAAATRRYRKAKS